VLSLDKFNKINYTLSVVLKEVGMTGQRARSKVRWVIIALLALAFGSAVGHWLHNHGYASIRWFLSGGLVAIALLVLLWMRRRRNNGKSRR